MQTQKTAITPEQSAARDIAHVVTLKKPVKLGEATWTQLTMEPLRARHLRGMPAQTSQMTVGTTLDIAAAMAGVPNTLVDELGPVDMAAVSAVVNAFLSLIQGDGD